MKKTMAILGDTGELFPEVLEGLMRQDLRLLFVSENEDPNRNIILKTGLEQTETVAEIEFTSCERDNCWEADIIMIIQPEKASCSLLDRIKEVATQKTVLLVSGNRNQLEKLNLQQLLPHSKVVEMLMDSQKQEFSVLGKDPEAVEEIMTTAGLNFQLNNF